MVDINTVLPADQRFNPLQKLKRALTDSFTGIDYSQNLLVMKTFPGNAKAIGALIDHLRLGRNNGNNLRR